jgi:tetratricopeptide (TPR) repeat protein
VRFETGVTVGRYVLFDLLGEGSMGAVYRAWDDALDRIVALKVMQPSSSETDPERARLRFEQEARLAARINHPAVAHVYDVGEHEGAPYIAMEFVPGRQLRADMSGGRQPAGRVVFLARQILDGLAEAHRVGVVHRDLKPENVMLSGRDQVKILDFGLAKPMFRDGRHRLDSSIGITGTPRYMAPEQLRGRPVDARTDLYAIGVVLYELLSGTPAHPAESIAELVASVLEPEPPRLPDGDLPPPLVETVRRAMSRDPEARFQTAEDMRDALERLLSQATVEDVDAPPAGPHLPHPRAQAYAQRARDALIGFGEAPSTLAIELAQKAVEIDPAYALAHALHAEGCALAFAHGLGDAGILDQAEASLARAETLEPQAPDVMVARARLVWNKTFNFPAETALRELVRALRLDPDHVGALRMWANVTGHLGLLELMEPAIQRRLGRDPNDQIMILLAAGLELQRGAPEAAIARLEPFTRLDPEHHDVLFWWLLAHARLLAGDRQACRRTVERLLERVPDDPIVRALAALEAAVGGDAETARSHARHAAGHLRSDAHPHHAYHLLAGAESMLGDPAAATAWLRRAADEGFPCWPLFSTDPMLEGLRRSPEGSALLKELERRHAFFRREFAAGV